MTRVEFDMNDQLKSLTDKELNEKGLDLMVKGILAIRQLTSEDYNSKIKEDFTFLLADAIHKLPTLCLNLPSGKQTTSEKRILLEREVLLAMKAIEKFNFKFPHRKII